MNHPPGCPDDEAGARELRRPLQELAIVERLADLTGSGGGPVTDLRDEAPQGPEFSVETMTRDGMHHVIGITGRQHEALAEAERAVLRSAVMALLDLAGHDAGLARTSVVLTGSGPRVVACELHAH